MGWTRERLEEVARNRLGGAKLIVVANREPYIHRYRDGEVEWVRPAGGLTTALDPVMRACGGVWVAHRSGDAEVTDDRGRVGVPPDDPDYTLRRVWLTKADEEGYYYGFANSTLWPLCHQVYRRPTFDPAHWAAYRRVNDQFAVAVLEEAEGGPALVFVQDYHFALLPRLLKAARPDLVVAQFWHIPWPNPETFRVCPWARELLDGMLGNDLLSFHTQYHCNNFLETVDRTVECRIDRERFSVARNGHDALVRPQPISVDPALADEYLGNDWERRAARLRKKLRLGDRPLLVGVDRVDYTKGIPERLRAVDRLLTRHPELAGTFHLVQLGAPSRTYLPAYQELNDQVRELAETINWRHGTPGWQPVVLLNEHLGPVDVFLLYRMAAGCVVGALHDGMNLVAKEFVTARPDEQGVLVLSRFTGGRPRADRRRAGQPVRRRRAARRPDHAGVRTAAADAADAGTGGRSQHLPVGRHAAVRGGPAGRSHGSGVTPTRLRSVRCVRPGGCRRREGGMMNLMRREPEWVAAATRAYRSGRPLALLFDYDGTLTPIVRHPSLARLSTDTRQRLDRLRTTPGVAVGVVTSRRLDEVRELVGLAGLFYAGSGGLELDLAGERDTYPGGAAFGRVLDAVQDDLLAVLRTHPGTWVERKPAALSVHYRGLLPLNAVCFRSETLQRLDCYPDVRGRVVSEAVEVTPAGGWDKGTAVERIMARVGPDAFPVYAGDAANDTEAIATASRVGGVTIGVGDDAPPEATHRVGSPAELAEGLDNLLADLAAVGRRPSAGEVPGPAKPAGVLIVDPDATSRSRLAADLAGRGWRVWTAGDPAAAAQTLRDHPGEMRAVIVDLQLPGLQGVRVLSDAQATCPSVIRCTMSADVSPYAAAAFRQMTDTPLFPKPVRAEALDLALRELTGR